MPRLLAPTRHLRVVHVMHRDFAGRTRQALDPVWDRPGTGISSELGSAKAAQGTSRFTASSRRNGPTWLRDSIRELGCDTASQ